MNCPYYQAHGKQYIRCRRGEIERRHTIDVKSHTCSFCNNKYRSCETYKKLEQEWGHDKVKQISVC